MDPPVVSTATHWGKSGIYKLRTRQGPGAEQSHPSLLTRPSSWARTRTHLASQSTCRSTPERFSNQRVPRACPSEPRTSTTPYSPQNNNFKAVWLGFWPQRHTEMMDRREEIRTI